MDHLSPPGGLWEAMESCRSGSDDLSDPQFADLAARLAEDPDLRVQFQRVQQADGAIKVAFAKVSAPVGLADRISRRLAEATWGRDRVAESADSLAATDVRGDFCLASAPPAPLRKQAERFSRRRLLVGFAAISAAAALLAAVWIETHPSRHDTPDSVLARGHGLFRPGQSTSGPLVSTGPRQPSIL